MATPANISLVRTLTKPLVMLWLATMGILAALLTLLSIANKNDPTSPQDITVLNWVIAWELPGLTGFMETVSFLTSNWPALLMGLAGISFVARTRPFEPTSGPSFPSGHTFGSTAFFGFWGFLGVYYGLNKKLLVPLVTVTAAIILTVGISRIYLGSHWPSDVVAGYPLGVLWLLAVIPLFLYLRKATWFSPSSPGDDLVAMACEKCRIEKSIASVVVLDPEQKTATKVYIPPPLVKLLYWLAFQSRFPYTRNEAALPAAAYRRKSASMLTIHRFGSDLVAPVTAINCLHGSCSFVTEFVPWEKVENDQEAKLFLSQVAETFAEASLSVWQINPRNPHAHTNLIRTPKGESKIIDLESAVVTILPAPGQWRSSLRRGSIPIFDDIDFSRLSTYITNNHAALEASLSANGLAQLKDAARSGEQAIQDWKDCEPRIWGWLISRVYRLLNWKAHFQHLMGALTGADKASEEFLLGRIRRWETDGRLHNSDAESLRAYISSPEMHDAMRHLGAHLVLSAIFRFPFGSIARMALTVSFWAKARSSRLRPRASAPEQRVPEIHNPLVMMLSVLPGVGAVAYLAARPLRRKLLIRLMLDQVAWKLPFKLYARMHLGRWLAPNLKDSGPSPGTPLTDRT